MPDFQLEDESLKPVAGFDEAGRGPWAGPVVASAVILPRDAMPVSLLTKLDDSKKVRKTARETLFAELRAVAEIGIGIASPAEIDEFNILQASMLAMQRAAKGLTIKPASALVDGNHAPDIPYEVKTIVKGDGWSLSIAAASSLGELRSFFRLAQADPRCRPPPISASFQTASSRLSRVSISRISVS